MRLLHLTAVGPETPNASLEFASRLTVVYGASETGKSYVIDAIDFMLGGKSIRNIPQAAPYRTLLLGVELNDGTIVTLARSLRGGKISIFEEDARSLPDRAPDRTLLGQHKKSNHENISHFLLSDLTIEGALLRKNQRNVLQAMSFRNLAHLCLIDEGRIQGRASPVESGAPTTRTAERSAFKLMLEGEDDSNLTTGQDPAEFRRTNRAQVAVLDRAVMQVRQHLEQAQAKSEVLDQRARVNRAIIVANGAVDEILERRDNLVALRNRVQTDIGQQRDRITEIDTLVSRFSLLNQQYTSDLNRLHMVKEAGTLLGYFEAAICVFCGASPEYQNVDHALYDSTEIAESVDAEVTKTQDLKQDLSETINDLATERFRTEQTLEELSARFDQVSSSILSLERQAQPSRDELTQLVERRSELEQWLGMWDQIDELETLRSAVSQEAPMAADQVDYGVSAVTQREFSGTLKRILTSWQVPGAADVAFEFSGSPDILLDHRSRADRGKGMRSVLHAGFSIALSEYCLERDLPHPGFVALDTPVLTYRDAEKDIDIPDARDELLSQSVSDAFYDYMVTHQGPQVIIVENQTPPDFAADGCSIVFFSGTPGVNRSGFYPL